MMSRLVLPGKLYESLLLKLERAMIAAVDAAEIPIAATVMTDNSIAPTVGMAWLLRFMLLGRVFEFDDFRLFCE